MRLLVCVALASLVCRSDAQGLFGFDPFKGISDAFKDPAGAFKNATESFNRAIKDPFGSFRDFVNQTSTAANNFTSELNQKVRDGLKDPAGAFKNATRDLGQSFGVPVATRATTEAPRSTTSGVPRGAANGVPIGAAVAATTRRAESATVVATTAAPNNADDFRKRIEDVLRNPFGALTNLSRDINQGIKDSVNNTLSNLSNVTKTIGQGLTDVVKDPIGALTNLTNNVNKGIGEAVNKTIGSLTNPTQNAGNDLRNFVTDPLAGLRDLTKSIPEPTADSQAEKSRPDPFDLAFGLLDDAVQNNSVLGVLLTVGPAIFQAIRPVFSGKSAKQAVTRINEIEKTAGGVLPYFVSFLLMGPMSSIKMPLNMVAMVQSWFGMS